MVKPVNLQTKLALLKPLIWREIKRNLPGRTQKLHYRMVQEYPRRQGKYFRPALFLISLELFGLNWKNHITLATVLQLCEDWLLVHDDIEDGSNERRGRPSLNKLYGDSLAINAGDALHVAMWETLFNYLNQNQTGKPKEIFEELSNILKTTLEDQFEDLWWNKEKNLNLSYHSYFQMVLKKTCQYTVVGPVKLAGIISGKPIETLNQITEWATPFGFSFQISDDLLDIKQDIKEGKRTLMLLHLLKKCSNLEKETIITIYRKTIHDRTEKEIDYILNSMHKYKSIEYATKQKQKFSEMALSKFEVFSTQFPKSTARNLIAEAIAFATNRNH